MSVEGLGDEGQHVPVLLAKRDDDGEGALDKAAAALALGFEGQFALDVRTAQTPLRRGVGRLDGGIGDGNRSRPAAFSLRGPVARPVGA